jgi:hypothetical protein
MKSLLPLFLLARDDSDTEPATSRPAKACPASKGPLRVQCHVPSFCQRSQRLFGSEETRGLAPECANPIQAAPRPRQTPSIRNHNRTRQWREGLRAWCHVCRTDPVGSIDDAFCVNRLPSSKQACRCLSIPVCHTTIRFGTNHNAVFFSSFPSVFPYQTWH